MGGLSLATKGVLHRKIPCGDYRLGGAPPYKKDAEDFRPYVKIVKVLECDKPEDDIVRAVIVKSVKNGQDDPENSEQN